MECNMTGSNVIMTYVMHNEIMKVKSDCVYSLLSSRSGYEARGEGEEVDKVSIKPFSEAAVMGGVKR